MVILISYVSQFKETREKKILTFQQTEIDYLVYAFQNNLFKRIKCKIYQQQLFFFFHFHSVLYVVKQSDLIALIVDTVMWLIKRDLPNKIKEKMDRSEHNLQQPVCLYPQISQTQLKIFTTTIRKLALHRLSFNRKSRKYLLENVQ